MNWSWWYRYVLNIDTIIAIIGVVAIVYFIFTSERKTYSFGLAGGEEYPSVDGYSSKRNGRSKKKKPKVTKVNKHEEECRRIFQQLFNVKFKSVRPSWLKNPATGKNLELDGYNPDIKTEIGRGLAFEYDGQQHSKFTPHFHRDGPDQFEYQVVKDSWKDKKCIEMGVTLIRIPHFVAFPDLERYIKMMLGRKNLNTGRGTKRNMYET